MAGVILMSISRGLGERAQHVGLLCTDDMEFAVTLKNLLLSEGAGYSATIRQLPGPLELDPLL